MVSAVQMVRSKDNERIMEPNYYSLEELMTKGEHLEHLHSYYGASVSEKEQAQEQAVFTMDFHVDAGLMIAMTTGHYANTKTNGRGGLSGSKCVSLAILMVILMVMVREQDWW